MHVLLYFLSGAVLCVRHLINRMSPWFCLLKLLSHVKALLPHSLCIWLYLFIQDFSLALDKLSPLNVCLWATHILRKTLGAVISFIENILFL